MLNHKIIATCIYYYSTCKVHKFEQAPVRGAEMQQCIKYDLVHTSHRFPHKKLVLKKFEISQTYYN